MNTSIQDLISSVLISNMIQNELSGFAYVVAVDEMVAELPLVDGEVVS